MKCTRFTGSECKRVCNGKCSAEKLYRPSNGTEGMIFEEHYCSQCIHDNPDPNHPKKCELIVRAMCFYETEPEYPLEWTYDALGHPRCTNYVNWNWSSDGDPNDPDNPKKLPDPPDPRQLSLFPLYTGVNRQDLLIMEVIK